MRNKLVDLQDTRFILYEQLCVEKLCKSEQFRDHSRDTFEMVLNVAEKLALNYFAPTNSEGDKIGCVWNDGYVKVPEIFHAPLKKYCEGGWISMAEDYSVGGQNLPYSVVFACSQMFFAANYALAGYMGLTHSVAKVIEAYGTPEQKTKYMRPLYEGKFAGTIGLTEAQAGSDLGAIRTKAVKNDDGSYSITGQKILITGGEQNLTENIIHLLLARIEGDPIGTRGLSCFIVPKKRVSQAGTLGDYNDLICTGVEEKMGLRGSATCVLTYGDNGRCQGELLGSERGGISVIFHAMNEQRLLVGLQGLAQGSTAYLYALEYARERRQGAEFDSETFEQVPIINHPDVKRNLLWMKAYTEGLRALILYTVYCIDRITAGNSEHEKRDWQDVVEVLTPVCKAYSADKGFEVCIRSIQIHGGYGYCKEYRVEQFARDCKISSIFEGTNGIQALDLFHRKIRMRGGSALRSVLSKMNETVGEASRIRELSQYAEEVRKSISAFQEVTKYLLELSAEDGYLAYSWATPYLEVFGDLALAWMFIWQAKTAYLSAERNGSKEAFYANKVNTAGFYISSILPLLYGKVEAIKRGDRCFHSIWIC